MASSPVPRDAPRLSHLYHLNAEEEPEMYDYPPEKDFPNFRKQFGPRGVLRCKTTDKDDAMVDPRF